MVVPGALRGIVWTHVKNRTKSCRDGPARLLPVLGTAVIGVAPFGRHIRRVPWKHRRPEHQTVGPQGILNIIS